MAIAPPLQGQRVVPPPVGMKPVFACSKTGFESLPMARVAQRNSMVDDAAFVTTRASFSPSGRIAVVDATAGVVYAVDRALQVVGTFGRRGEGPGELKAPADAAIDDEGNVWVLDTEPSTLAVFEPNGDFLTEVRLPGRPDRLALSAAAVYLSSPVVNFHSGARAPFVWRYDRTSRKVTPVLIFDARMDGRPPIFRNTVVRTIPKVGPKGVLYVGFEESNEVWRVRPDGSHEVAVRGCIPDLLRSAYSVRDVQPRRTGVLLSDFVVLDDGRVLVRGGLVTKDGGRPWVEYAPSGETLHSWSLTPPGLLNLYVAIDPTDPSTQLTWDGATGSAKLVRVSSPASRRR